MAEKCSIWGTAANRESFESASGSKAHWVTGFHMESRRAGGRYSIEKSASDEVGSTDFDNWAKARLTTWIVDQHHMGTQSPKVTQDIINSVRRGRPLPVHRRADRLLQYIAKQSPFLGYTFYYYPTIEVQPAENDESFDLLAVSESLEKTELVYLFDFLKSLGFLKDGSSSHDRLCFIVSPKGHAHLMELESTKVDSMQGFVAMWFDDSMKDVYQEGFERAIAEAGYKPLRIDRKDHNNKIDDEIIAEIRRSRFLVADFTQGADGARGGVYYEAGFAHGIGIPVIFTCQKGGLSKTHFDTRQYNHIEWNTAEDLKVRLAQRISATMGDGPLISALVKRDAAE